jgi:NADH-quinone oxidoreductase subunit G
MDESLGDFESIVAEHYLTNPVARASELMGELAGKARARRQQKIAAE